VTMPPSKPPADVQEYLQCAIECSPGVPLDLSDGHAAVLSRLHRCGVVHLHNLFPVLLLKEMSEAVEQLRGGQYASMGYDDLHDVATLRGGRVEIWLPHVAPFNDETLIQTPLRHLIDGYFGGSGGLSVLQYATTIISKHGVTEDQELHSDVPQRGRHLELHIPLVDVTLEMGPTRMCPCTHGSQVPGSLLDHKEIRESLGELSEEFNSTHYDAVTQLGHISIYDGAIQHKGLANRAQLDRPVVVFSFASSHEVEVLRNHTGHLPSRLPIAARELNKFKVAFATSRNLS